MLCNNRSPVNLGQSCGGCKRNRGSFETQKRRSIKKITDKQRENHPSYFLTHSPPLFFSNPHNLNIFQNIHPQKTCLIQELMPTTKGINREIKCTKNIIDSKNVKSVTIKMAEEFFKFQYVLYFKYLVIKFARQSVFYWLSLI